MNIGRLIVAEILRSGDLQPYLDAGLTSSWVEGEAASVAVFDGVDKQAYLWLLDHHRKHGTVSPDLFARNFPPVSYRLSEEPFKPLELIEAAKDEASAIVVGELSDELIDLFDEARWGDVVATLQTTLGRLQAGVGPAGTRDSWEPIDAAAFMASDRKPVEAELGARGDGVNLLYPGKTHSLVGESEAGKSWLALHWVAQELDAGNDVGYLDFEDSAEGIFGRLEEMVNDARNIARHFLYVRPEGPLADAAGLIERLSHCSLVIVDGISEAMEMVPNKANPNDWNARYVHFQGVLLNPIAAAGPAVLSIDHPVKAPMGNQKGAQVARHASGAGHKLRGMSGASYVLHNVEPFGRGRLGNSVVYVAKDRPGHVRSHGFFAKRAGMVCIARLVISNLNDDVATEVNLENAEISEEAYEAWRPTFLMWLASEALRASDEPLSKTALRDKFRGKTGSKTEAIDFLIQDGYFEYDPSGKKLISVRPYVENEGNGQSERERTSRTRSRRVVSSTPEKTPPTTREDARE